MAICRQVSVTLESTCFKKFSTKKTATIIVLIIFILTSFLLTYWKYLNISSFFTKTHRKAPFQAFLQNNNSEQCGGVLISPEFILTAAHCLAKTKEVSIILGVDRIDDTTSPKRLSLKSSNFIIHHNYNPEKNINDLALIKIPPIPLIGSHVDVAHIPSSSKKIKQKDYIGELVRSFGWAHHDRNQSNYEFLKEKKLVVLNMFYCDKFYENDEFDNNSQLCLFGYGRSGKVCSGDSGSPILSDDGSVLVGIVSKGGEDCAEGKPVVGVKLDYYLDWINFQMFVIEL